MPMIHDREESPLQTPPTGAQGKFSAAKADELLRALRKEYSGVVSIYPRERDACSGGHANREMAGTA